METGEIEFLYVIYRIVSASLAMDANRFFVGISCESASIFKKRVHALVFLHFINHRALHLSGNRNQTIVGSHNDDIIICQAYIAGQFAIENVIIDIYHCNQFVMAINLDVSQCTQVVGATCHIECVENGGKGR